MKVSFRLLFTLFCASALLVGCASKKRKANKEPNALGKFYHNTTALYNGYFNANEIMKETYLKMDAANQDDYTKILSLYGHTNAGDTKAYEGELDRAIEKVTTVAMLHEPSRWVDDCYVLMGEAQFLKKDFESAEETFFYFKEEFSPKNPFGRNYQKKKVSKKQIKKEKEKERKEKEKVKKEEKKDKQKERDQKKKEREAEQKAQKKEREAERKRREKEKKARKKNKKRSKKRKSGGKKKRPAKKETKEETTDVVPPVKKETPAETKENEVKKEVIKEDPRAADPGEKEDDEEFIKPKEEVKKKKDKTAYSKGLMWLSRTYVERDKYSNAKFVARKLQQDGGLPNDVERELPVILADVAIKENDYTEALVQLDEAIELANDKKKKSRYAFVAGQLAEKLDQRTDAAEYYTKAKKWTGDFRMEFMAQLSAEKNSMQGGKSKKAVIAKLDRMIKETKYNQFLDQLYYTKGEILLDDNQFNEALTNFRLSTKNNTSNKPLKVETYYKLANLFYDREDYVEAKFHYDSTMQVMEKDDNRYDKSKKYSENLTEIANLITSIELQDSMLNLAKLDDVQLRKMAEKLVEEGFEKQKSVGAAKKNTNLLTAKSSRSFNRSNFWAYNLQTRQRHAADFKRTWGTDLELQDDWRRKDKQGFSSTEGGEDVAAEVSEQDQKDQAVKDMMVNLKSQIPYSSEQKANVYALLSSSLYELGRLYRDKLANYSKSIATHEELLKRFGADEKKLDVYYYLYLSNLDLPDAPRAEYYKNKIINEFPDTDYARVISDPAYAESLNNEEQRLEDYYRDTYAAFESGDYNTAYNKSKDADNKFGKDNIFKPKFHLLNAMALGSIKGKDIYVKALREVIAKNPNTPEKARAEEIMRFILGDSEAFDNTDMEEVDDIFSEEDNLKHYLVVVVYNSIPATLDKIKLQVSNYNKDVHTDLRLQMSDSTLDKEKGTDLVLIRKFKNKAESMVYYKDIQAAGGDFIAPELGAYSAYAISQRNYRKMVIEKSDSRYRVFFNKYYLGK